MDETCGHSHDYGTEDNVGNQVVQDRYAIHHFSPTFGGVGSLVHTVRYTRDRTARFTWFFFEENLTVNGVIIRSRGRMYRVVKCMVIGILDYTFLLATIDRLHSDRTTFIVPSHHRTAGRRTGGRRNR